MAKLTLQFEGRALKEYTVGKSVTIGRLPDNTVVIDNPAVSGHHARIFPEGGRLVLEDLRSTNGTFVNEQHVYRHVLRHGDLILVGKHTLAFEGTDSTGMNLPQPALAPLGDTMYLDTKQHRALLATLRAARAEADVAAGALPTVSVAPALDRTGVLRVLSGPAEHPEYDLDAQTTIIGRSTHALVRLRGWLKPDVAVAIARTADGYVATRFGGKTLVNDQPLRGRYRLKECDILLVSGLTLEFRFKRQGDAPMAVDEPAPSQIMSAGQRAATVRAFT